MIYLLSKFDKKSSFALFLFIYLVNFILDPTLKINSFNVPSNTIRLYIMIPKTMAIVHFQVD